CLLRLWLGCFFFSSRRRHTRFSRDWSSDVCSSDLGGTWLPRQKFTQAICDVIHGAYTTVTKRRDRKEKLWRKPSMATSARPRTSACSKKWSSYVRECATSSPSSPSSALGRARHSTRKPRS